MNKKYFQLRISYMRMTYKLFCIFFNSLHLTIKFAIYFLSLIEFAELLYNKKPYSKLYREGVRNYYQYN